MKKTIAVVVLLLAAGVVVLLLKRPAGSRKAAEAPGAPARGSLSLSGAWALYPLAIRWQEEFQKSHPGTVVDVQAGGAGKGIADALAGVVDIGMVSREINPAEVEKGAVALAVAKDAVVATVSAKNPLLADLLRRGLKKEDLAALWMRVPIKSWEALLDRDGRTAVHVFTRSDACGAAETWAAYLGGHQEDLTGVGVYGDPGLAEAVRRDPLAIGFNNVNFAYDAKTLRPVAGLGICPIDLDGNGRIDPAESVYATRDDLVRAIAAHVYPSPPARDLYFVIKGQPGRPRQPDRPLLADFLTWVLTEGQQYVAEMGYIAVSPDRVAAGLATVRGSAEKK
ncbi:MAG: PstS family phosphate ABC transporter substrate-binding protein [Candidatus Aminicenantes bacterium]|nr:PstS family phosphate ABC transporter substrate-binding protein [Candidatus Aminicenantes bacterium]